MTSSDPLPEELIQDSFHSYLKSSLTQAKAERLLDADILSSAEGDLMITGPALCLYFAALRCTTHPPSVPLPRSGASKSSTSSPPIDLSPSNCPPAFKSFLLVWASNVPLIQSLPPEHQHDLARVICGLPPISSPIRAEVNGVAADLRAVAIEISQRRSFQERYGGDLQAVLDSDGGGGSTPGGRKVSFVPPPGYAESAVSSSGPGVSPTSPNPPSSPSRSNRPASLDLNKPLPSPASQLPAGSSSTTFHLLPPPSTPASSRQTTPSPTLLPPDSPAISLIRETLYAALGDALSSRPSLLALLSQSTSTSTTSPSTITDKPRIYYAALTLAILDVSQSNITPQGSIIGVLGNELTLSSCPPPLRPLMKELAEIGKVRREVEEEDDEEAVKAAQNGTGDFETRMERVRKVLEGGVGWDLDSRSSSANRDGGLERRRTRSIEGRAVAFANRINALALKIGQLPQFRERQDEVFAVLAALAPGR